MRTPELAPLRAAIVLAACLILSGTITACLGTIVSLSSYTQCIYLFLGIISVKSACTFRYGSHLVTCPLCVTDVTQPVTHSWVKH